MTGERCEACGDPAGASWRGHTVATTDGIGGPLCPECWDLPAEDVEDKVRITRLSARLALAEAVIEAATRMRDEHVERVAYCTEFDAALQAFDSVSPGSSGGDSTMLIRLSPTAQRIRALTNNRHCDLRYPVDTHDSIRILLHMNDAIATYTKLSSTEALITVDYPNGGFGMERVTKPRLGSLYDAAYSAASVKAEIQGFRLGRFSEAA